MRLRGITVLVVEDDVDNLELVSTFLDGEGARVIEAGSIVAALAKSEGQRVDTVVSDLELADGDGCALLEQLRARNGGRLLPAIAVTGYSQEKWRNKAEACGFARYLVKPYSLDALVEWISELSRPSAVSA
jgi:two-component system CheB/CheR fusion protein